MLTPTQRYDSLSILFVVLFALFHSSNQRSTLRLSQTKCTHRQTS